MPSPLPKRPSPRFNDSQLALMPQLAQPSVRSTEPSEVSALAFVASLARFVRSGLRVLSLSRLLVTSPVSAYAPSTFVKLKMFRISAYIVQSTRPTRKPLLRSEEHTSELQSRPHLVCR